MSELDPVDTTAVTEELKVETPEGFIALDKHQKDVNVQHKKFRDQERGRVAAEERATAAETELQKLKENQAEIVIPIVDRNSETFEEDMQARDTAIQQQANLDAEKVRKAEQVTKNNEARQADDDKAFEVRIAKFDSNMVGHGLNPTETKAAADTVLGYGISEVFQDVLLEDPDGPLFVQYLANNPIEAEAMNGMSTLQLVKHLDSDIRQKALLLKPQTSNAPNPPITLIGGGAPETKEDWEHGAVYD